MSDFQLRTFSALKKNLKKDYSGFQTIRLAVLGDTATQFLCQALRGEGFDQQLNITIWEADFDQIETQIFDSASELYQFKPEWVLVFLSTHKLLARYDKQKNTHEVFADDELVLIKKIYQSVTENLGAKLIVYNYPEIDDAVFGNHANKVSTSFLFQVRKLNYEMMLLAGYNSGLYVCDLSSVQNKYGRDLLFNAPVYVNTEMVLSIDLLPVVAAKTVGLIGALKGRLKKCLILDLDNTLWGGIIGDDGLENIQIGNLGIGKAFTEFQYWIKKLKQRGVILAVCSKNTESVAKEVFEKHPDMVLKLEDIAVFIANWENKADNIRQIQSILNIGFDSMVFLDDSSFERNMVRENIQEITVPEMPEDPADYLEYLYSLQLFETVSFSNEDINRNEQYQKASQRANAQINFVNENDFLQSLEMASLVEPFTKFNIPRVAQLSQRSNQFNLRTVRHSESDIEQLSGSKEIFPFTFTLEDRFGDYGLICLVVLSVRSNRILFIENWLMSCRVLKRGMEQFVLNTVAAFAQKKGFDQLIGEYLATEKNAMVKDHYKNLGFVSKGDQWILDVTEYREKKCYIQNKQMVHG